MSNGLLLWIDDEIELLKAHIIFLEKKGYEVATVSNGSDAIELCRQQTFDLILLDEMMPGLSGLETLQQIKDIQPATPVVMCTKSEEENIMDQAIGSKIADYLIKPVNPSQILLSLKKNIHQKDIVTEMTQSGYQQDYQQIAMQMMEWELELSDTDSQMTEMLAMQKEEANIGFAKFIARNYLEWIDQMRNGNAGKNKDAGKNGNASSSDDRPMMSPDVFRNRIFPILDKGEKVFLIVDEDMYMSILPTATQYARNAIFSGLMPNRIAEMFPELWVDEDEEEGKNLNEEPLIQTMLDRYRKRYSFSYHKVNDSQGADRFMEHYNECREKDLNVLVLNFIDMLSHARTESKMVRELANTESAYRSITQSWLRHSVLSELFRRLSQDDCKVVITTDHGSIRASKPIKIIGDRNTNTNLRYKLGKNLVCNAKEVFTIRDPKRAQLPAPNLSTSYVFAYGDAFFAYPNNYNYYVSYYKDTFQHGGISMEEMLIPIITLTPRKRN